MSKSKKPLAIAIGSAFAVSLAVSPQVSAEQNPFSMNELSSGYQVADSKGDMEGNCGGKKEKNEKREKYEEGEGNCGAKQKARKEGQCGEAKCGANKKEAKKEVKESNCGGNMGNMKSNEGKCGANKE